MKHIFILLVILSTYSFSQVVVSKSNTSNAFATLDINYNGQLTINGIKPPIVSKQDLIDKRTINGNTYTYLYNETHMGTFVYVDDLVITTDEIKETSNIVEIGIYYFDGVAWYGIASELKDYAIFAVGDPQSLIPSNRDVNFANNVTTKVSLSFTQDDKVADNIAILGSYTKPARNVTYSCDTDAKYDDVNFSGTWCDNFEDTTYYYFEIKEDGFYEISNYIGYNPNRGLNSTNQVSYALTKIIMCNDPIDESKCMLKFWDTQHSNIKEIAATGNNFPLKISSSISTITTPKTVTELKSGDRLYFYLIIPEIVMDNNRNNNGFSGFNGSTPFYNITKTSNNVDYLQFSKFVSIRKL